MNNQLANLETVDRSASFQSLGAKNELILAQSWNDRVWPTSAWKDITANQTAMDSQIPHSKEALVKVFNALGAWCKGSGDSSFCTTLIVHYLLCRPIISKYFPDYKMEKEDITCFALTEKSGGSTPFDMSVEISADSMTVSGEKWHITNAPQCNHFLVFGIDPASKELAMALVPAGQASIKVEELHPEGMKNSPVGLITFEKAIAKEVVVSDAKVKRAIMQAFEAERLAIGFVSAGSVEHHFNKMIKYLINRVVGGKRIIKHQYLQKRITDIKIDLDCLNAMVTCTINDFLEGKDISMKASEIKFLGISLVTKFAENAIKCYGSYGVQQDLGLMRLLADSMCGSIAGGTEEVHRNLIFTKLLREQVRSNR